MLTNRFALDHQAPRFFINYDDGDKGWVNCHQLRILAQRSDQGKRVVTRYEFFPLPPSSEI